MALPTRGQPDWDDELGNHIAGLEASVQSAVANASAAISNANEARNVAQSVQNAVVTPAEDFVSERIAAESPVIAPTLTSRGNLTIGLGDSITGWNDSIVYPWAAGTAYQVGNIVARPDNGDPVECVIGHTAPSTFVMNANWRIAPKAQGGSFFSHACALSGQRMRFLRNAGIGGDTTAGMLARLQADVLDYGPNKVVVTGGTNDVGFGVPQATIRANLEGIVDAIQAAGAEVIMGTVVPYQDTARRSEITKLNGWIKRFAADRGIHVFDLYSQVVNPADGMWKSGYNFDNAHPKEVGRKAIASYVAANLPNTFAFNTPYLAGENADPTNLVTNGLFLTDAGADGTADGFTVAGAGASTRSLVAMTADEGIGNWQQIANTAGAWSYIEQTIASSWSVGDTISLAGKFKVLSTSGNFYSYVHLEFVGATAYPRILAPLYNWGNNGATAPTAGQDWAGTFYDEVRIPPGTTSIKVRASTGASGGAGTLSVGQLTVRNLTTLGLL